MMRKWTWHTAETNGPVPVASINCQEPDGPGFGFIVPAHAAPFITDACNEKEAREAGIEGLFIVDVPPGAHDLQPLPSRARRMWIAGIDEHDDN